MNFWQGWPQLLMTLGAGLFLAGVIIHLMQRFQVNWRLPGDIFWQKGNLTVFFPLATCIIISILLTVLVNLIWRK